MYENQQKLDHLARLAGEISPVNPVLSRIYRCIKNKYDVGCDSSKSSGFLCKFCGNAYNLDKFRTRFSPKMRLTSRILRILLKAQDKKQHISKFSRHLLDLYKNSSTKMAVKCLVCRKSEKMKGPSREVLLTETKTSVNSTQNEMSYAAQQKELKRQKRQMKKLKKKKKNKNGGLLNVSGDSGFEVSLLSLPSPLISSTPKTVSRMYTSTPASHTNKKLVEDSNVSHDQNSSQSNPPVSSLWKSQSLSENQSSNRSSQNKSLSDLLKGVQETKPSVKKSVKKKKPKDMHLKLQTILKNEKQNQESSGSLEDFLSSL